MSFYRQRIEQLAPGSDPEKVEAWMRLACTTLDGLSAERFAAEVAIGAAMASEYPEDTEQLVSTYFAEAPHA